MPCLLPFPNKKKEKNVKKNKTMSASYSHETAVNDDRYQVGVNENEY